MVDIAGEPFSQLTNLNVTGEFRIQGVPIGPNTSPSGPTDAVQFNAGGGNFGGSANLLWDGSTLSVTGDVTANNFNGVALTSGGSASDFLNAQGNYVTAVTNPAGADTELQFNDSGSFGASASLTWGGVSLNAPQFNGVALTTGGSASNFLNEAGAYTTVTANPAGANTEVQFNSGGVLSANANFTFNGTSVNATQFNGASITAAGTVTNFLNATGSYSVPTGTPSGADTQVQFNNAGSFDGSANLTWNGTTLNATQFNGVSLTTAGSATQYLDGSGAYSTPVSSPAGGFNEVQFNNAGVLGGDSNFTWNGTSLDAIQFNGVALTTAGSSLEYLDASGGYSVPASTAPAGANGEIQFNTGGAFDADSNLTWNGSALTVASGSVDANTFNGAAFNGGNFTGGNFNAVNVNGIQLTSVGSGVNFLDDDGTYRTLTFADIPIVYGEWKITSTNGTVTPLTQNVPAKLLTGGNDTFTDINGTTSSADNRVDVNESETADFRIIANLGLDKSGGGNEDFELSIYMDGSPLPTPIYINDAIGQDDVVSFGGVANGVSSGAHFFEVWIEGTSDNDDMTLTTGQMSVERIN